MAKIDVGKELIAMDLPNMLLELGKAVIYANTGQVDFSIPEAEIELRIAIHVSKQQATEASGGVNLYGIQVNAGYNSMFGYSAEGSSLIRIKFKALPKAVPVP